MQACGLGDGPAGQKHLIAAHDGVGIDVKNQVNRADVACVWTRARAENGAAGAPLGVRVCVGAVSTQAIDLSAVPSVPAAANASLPWLEDYARVRRRLWVSV